MASCCVEFAGNTPTISNPCVCNAPVGAVGVGTNGSIWVKISDSGACSASQWTSVGSSAACISTDANNSLQYGTDGCLYVPSSSGSGTLQISTDTNNMTTLGGDGGIYTYAAIQPWYKLSSNTTRRNDEDITPTEEISRTGITILGAVSRGTISTNLSLEARGNVHFGGLHNGGGTNNVFAGSDNQVNGTGARNIVAGQFNNVNSAAINNIVSGTLNTSSGQNSLVIGENNTAASTTENVLILGEGNLVQFTTDNTLVAGSGNTVNGAINSLVVGRTNTLSDFADDNAIIASATSNSSKIRSAIIASAGITINQTAGDANVVIGSDQITNSSVGERNVVLASDNSTLTGDADNTVLLSARGAFVNGSDLSLIGGRDVDATHNQVLVFGATDGIPRLATTQDKEFRLAFPNGGTIFTDEALTTSVSLTPGSTGWTVASSQILKEFGTNISQQEFLTRMRSLPVRRGNYIGYNDQHFMITSEDFNAAFGDVVQPSTITTHDSSGNPYTINGINIMDLLIATIAYAQAIDELGGGGGGTGGLAGYNQKIVYDDFLNSADTWVDTSWGTQRQFVPKEGTDNMIQVDYSTGWGALYYYNLDGLDTKDIDFLSFQVYGDGSAGNDMIVHLVGPGDNFLSGTRYDFVPFNGQWMTHVVSLAQLGDPSLIKGVVFQNYDPNPGGRVLFDNIYFYNSTPVLPDDNIEEVTVDPNVTLFEVNPEIYGINHATPGMVSALNIPYTRWGGNGASRYRWNNDTMTHINWYFQNYARGDGTNLPTNNYVNRWLDSLAAQGLPVDRPLITIPMTGWWPKSRVRDVSYSISKYGAQQGVAPDNSDAGNGVLLNGNEVFNDPTDASAIFTVADIQTWVQHLITRNGTKYIALDNEPMLWHETHKDIRAQGTNGVGYDEYYNLTVQYASMIKALDPTIQVFGPCSWGWEGFFFSGKDRTNGGPTWWDTRPDRMAHGDTPWLQWYLQQMATYEINNGIRLLDFLEVHLYPSAPNVFNAAEGSTTTQELRLRSTKDLWDSTYDSESYINQPIQLIPRMKSLIDTYYPGTKLCIGEYNWGANKHFNGGLAQCEILAIFNEQGDKIDQALLWNSNEDFTENDYVSTAFKLFRNYNGSNGRFGQFILDTTVADRDKLTFIAAKDEFGNITAVAINKTNDTLTLDLTGITLNTGYRFQSGSTNLTQIANPGLTVPPMSATIYECS